ncbi:hypothetical protein [Chryseobacterium gleum]|uniref:hypothetical protein n=1 Tax=Chryseobacterium gleum TaxID=250 RepID=UPI00241D685F|nr:hypothetical protein [Chryseobacterium gleum]
MTQQIRDSLFYEGKEYYLNNEILEYYFNEFPEHRPEHTGAFSACWRGYVAFFEIKDNELLIKNVKWMFSEENKTHKLKDLFPNTKFDWFSGLIRMDGFRGEYDDENNEEAIYELLEIREGNLLNHWKLNFEEFNVFKEILFRDFKTTTDYEKLFLKWKNNNPGITETEIDHYIFQNIIYNVRKI